MIPFLLRIFFIPKTKSFRFGTCGNTLNTISMSAFFPELTIFSTVFVPKKLTIVGIPDFSAIFATFEEGSIPNTGMSLSLKFFKR